MPVTNYFWDMESDNVLLEKDEAGATTAVYTNEPELYGKLISQHRDGETYFHHYDGSGDTRLVTDENENIVETVTYSAFGEVVEKTSSIANPFGYKGAQGYYANPETSDCYVRARTYEPRVGRWLSQDPLSFAGDANLFVYVGNDPIDSTDPSGLLQIIPLRDNFESFQKCVDATWIYWDFHLDKKAPCKGYFIQKISLRCAREACPCEAPSRPTPLPAPAATYFEVWPVSADETITDYRIQSATYTDRSSFRRENDTCGYYIAEGEVRFYCENEAEDPRPPEQRAGTGPLVRHAPAVVSVCGWQISSGRLAGSINEPRVWSKAPLEGPATRLSAQRWACCNCQPHVDVAAGEPRKAKW